MVSMLAWSVVFPYDRTVCDIRGSHRGDQGDYSRIDCTDVSVEPDASIFKAEDGGCRLSESQRLEGTCYFGPHSRK
jgi:hypothetical protein